MSQSRPSLDVNAVPADNALYEIEHVHKVYESIAPHFSSTRFKPWPIVGRFLNELPPGSVGLDIGCGNGKYLGVNRNIIILGSDRSRNLVEIASAGGRHEAVVSDALDLPHPSSRFDFAISIAVIHHFSSEERRVAAIKNIIAILKPDNGNQGESGGRALIYVWALEQKGSRRGWDENSAQDVLVPWVMAKKFEAKDGHPEQVYQRYYHLYRQGELETDVTTAGGIVCESGYERDNWWAIVRREDKN